MCKSHNEFLGSISLEAYPYSKNNSANVATEEDATIKSNLFRLYFLLNHRLFETDFI